MKQRIRLTESKLHRIIKESVRRVLKEENEDWYAEEDHDGKTGEYGMVRSYDVGYLSERQEQANAEEHGMSLDEYLKEWFFEIKPECPWFWQRLGGGYGYNGTTIFREGGVVCKEIYGQIMFDEYPDGKSRGRLSH